MAALTGNSVASTYKDLLQVSNSNAGVDATLRTVDDGEGTASALSISSAAIQVDNIKIDGNTITSEDTNGNITLTPNGTGDVEVSTGNLVIGTSGKGIDFSANTDDYGTPASGAEVLDDYEEGTWTASYGGSTDAGTYTKIGRMVYANVLIQGASESFTAITGLPFTASSSYNTGMIGRSLDADTIDSGGSVARLYVFGTSIHFKDNGGTGTGADASHTVTTSADTVRLQITTVYEA